MEYITRNCPKCNGELHVPSNLETCICMYCGESIELVKKPVALDEASLASVKEEYDKTVRNLSLLVNEYDKVLTQFTRDKYRNSFQSYEQKSSSAILALERYATLPDQTVEKVAQEIAKLLVDTIEKELQSSKGGIMGQMKERSIDQYRFFLTVYLVPMVRHLGYDISEPLADHILEQWCSRHPKFTFKKADYDNIEAGFRRKGLCFITTAVCETLDKEDDCYELTTLRQFRDSYMLQSQDGRDLVEEYYRIAPAIVTYINMGPDRNEKYKGIWNEFLQPCIMNIEEGHPELCEKQYVQMVGKLRKEMPYEL